MRLFRDGYNKTNLHIGGIYTGAYFYAVDEPWDGPAVGILLRFRGRRWLRLEAAWR